MIDGLILNKLNDNMTQFLVYAEKVRFYFHFPGDCSFIGAFVLYIAHLTEAIAPFQGARRIRLLSGGYQSRGIIRRYSCDGSSGSIHLEGHHIRQRHASQIFRKRPDSLPWTTGEKQ